MRTSITLTSILISTFAFATLPPTTCSPLGDHMMEVNKEWAHMWPEIATSQNVVCFENESSRIRHHLELVVEHLSGIQHENRNVLLSALKEYAEEELFPQNHVLSYRNPVFIDPYGTACAVGHLMIESGHKALAEHIDSEMELAYVKEMKLPAIFDWASTYGFTEDELAWIQPGYPPNTFWTAPGGGLNGEVDAMTWTSNNLLVVAGKFDLIGNPSASQIASWDGTSYTALGNGLLGTVYDLIEFNGQIYAAGSFYILNSFHDIAVWDGSNWTYGNAQYGMAPANFDLEIHNNDLYVGGLSSGFAGVSHMVMKKDAGTWNHVGTDLNDTIWTIASYEGTIYAGGQFTATFGSSIPMSHVAYLDTSGTWVEAYSGLNGTVYDLIDVYGNLYAGGLIGDVNNPLFGLSMRYAGDVMWTDQLDYMNQQFLPFNGLREIRALEMVGSQLFACGSFELQPLVGTVGQNIMWVDQGSGYGVMQATMDGPVNCMQEGLSTSLFVGGEFSTMNLQSIPNIGWTDVTVMLVEETDGNGISLWPTPSTGTVQVQIESNLIGEVGVITDANGRELRSIQLKDRLNSIDLTDLANGAYHFTIENNRTVQRFVISR